MPHVSVPSNDLGWFRTWVVSASILLCVCPDAAWSQEVRTTLPLLTTGLDELPSLLPSESHLLLDASTLEQFLSELEGAPPDWATVYGHGHHDPDHDDRLFNLNRERDARRDGKPALQWLITFAWAGELSRYDTLAGGFHVAMGPTFIPTSWGVVRFKAEDPPSNLVAVPEAPLREKLLAQLERHQPIDILVLMTGHLIPQESIVYDFSHEEEGLGLIMPVLRLEQLDYVMIR